MLNFSENWFSIKEHSKNPTGFEWMCYVKPTGPDCSSTLLQDLSSWNVSARDWPLLTTVYMPNTAQRWVSRDIIEVFNGNSMVEDGLAHGSLTWTRDEIEAFLSYMLTNPPPEQVWAYLNNTSWIASAGPGLNVSTLCPNYGAGAPLLDIRVDHCLSHKIPERCRLFYHLPIAFAIIICSLVKVACIWLLLRIDRHDLSLTIGDAISSFLQRPDPTTRQWCTLSPAMIAKEDKCPWNPKHNTIGQEGLWTQEPHAGHLPAIRKTWRTAGSSKIWSLTWVVLILYIVISLVLPTKAVQNTITHRYSTSDPLVAMWNIKGWGEVQSTALLSTLATSFIGMVLLANMPQLAVSLLYFCLNDTLTREILAADYNDFAITRRPLRVSFPRGEQRSSWYLTIPYRYAVPFLTTVTLIHWFISEGLFYVQVLPYNIHGNPIPSVRLETCGVSTIPLLLALFLMISAFLSLPSLAAGRSPPQ